MIKMKKYFILILLILSPVIYSQLPRLNTGTNINDGTGDNLWITGHKLNQTIDSLNNIINRIYSGTFSFNNIRVGGDSSAVINKITQDSAGIMLYSNGSPVPSYIPPGNRISISKIPTIPALHYNSGDTSLYPIPDKIGDGYLDTNAKKEYRAFSASRGGWVKIN
jgi:hypothetical protein